MKKQIERLFKIIERACEKNALRAVYPHGVFSYYGGLHPEVKRALKKSRARMNKKFIMSAIDCVNSWPSIYRGGFPLYGKSFVEYLTGGRTRYLVSASKPVRDPFVADRLAKGDRRRYLKSTIMTRWVIMCNYDCYRCDDETGRFYINWDVVARRLRERDFGRVPKRVLWAFYFNGKVPQRNDIKGIRREQIPLLVGKMKTLANLVRELPYLYGTEAIGYANAVIGGSMGLKLLDLVGAEAMSMMKTEDVTKEDVLSFMYRNIKDARDKRAKFVRALLVVKHRDKVGLCGKFDDLYAQASEVEFAEDPIRKYCEMGNAPYHTYEEIKQHWSDLCIRHDIESVSSPVGEHCIDDGGFVIKVLKKTDPLASVIGVVTDCCQHLAGVGATCAAHSIISSDGACVVVFKNRIPVATSWLWRRGDVVVLDNIEVANEATSYDRKVILQAFKKLAEMFINLDGYVEVRVGTRNSDVDLSHLTRCEDIVPLPEGYEGYSDSQECQVLLVKRTLQDDGDLVRFIKDIEEAAYPEEYRQLQYCYTMEDVADYLEVSTDRAHVFTGADWYCLVGEHDDYIEVADLASATRSMKREDILSLFVKLAKLAGQRVIVMDARETTSYPLVQRLASDGMVVIIVDEPHEWAGEIFHRLTIQLTEKGLEWVEVLMSRQQ